MTRKYYNTEECESRRWYSKAEWRRRGLKIHDDAKPAGTLWIRSRKGSIDVFAEEQGTWIAFNSRESKLRNFLDEVGRYKTHGGEPITDPTLLRWEQHAPAGLL